MKNELHDACAEACLGCATACECCMTACLSEADVGTLVESIRLDHDCAEICRLAAAWLQRDSRFAGTICEICAIVCTACGDECERHPTENCRACAKACRKCAELCRTMVGGAVPETSSSVGLAESIER